VFVLNRTSPGENYMANQEVRTKILNQVKVFGGSLAGIASLEELKRSPSYQIYPGNPYYSFFDGMPDWPKDAKSVLAFALEHKQGDPSLDWWDPRPGGTPGNRILIDIQNQMEGWLADELGIFSISLPYKIEKGGVFLKDTAVLAGLGIIGKNNLLITPEYGSRIRLRAMYLSSEFDSTGPSQFDPCLDCARPCFSACPEDAFRSGYYQREYCQNQMKDNEDKEKPHPEFPEFGHVRYCRACELACPVPGPVPRKKN